MRLIVLFSGQGHQTPAHRDEAAAGLDSALRAAADAALAPFAPSLAALADNQLHDNRVAQVLIWSLQWVRWQALQALGVRPSLLAGYSAGETAAFTAAGLCSAEAGLSLAAERARLMSEASAALGEPAGMLAVTGCDGEALAAALAGLRAYVAIRTASAQAVVAGLESDLGQLVDRLARLGGIHTNRLAVTVPAHTPLLAPVRQPWQALLQSVAGSAPALTLLSGTRAVPVRDRDSAIDALAEQVCTPIAWDECLETMAEYQPDAVLELGPGSALARMVLARGWRCPVRAVDEFRSFAAVGEWLARCAP
ncbi:MAG: acyltransferase domain-containing protein [Betaproteobacteria bacterium]|nr:acyltransferase domain-containing protein [Betaproteobacteria bacterium]MDE2622966.1 acyltransferase domain-containing protein [Betaproteobacteria bacterium]